MKHLIIAVMLCGAAQVLAGEVEIIVSEGEVCSLHGPCFKAGRLLILSDEPDHGQSFTGFVTKSAVARVCATDTSQGAYCEELDKGQGFTYQELMAKIKASDASSLQKALAAIFKYQVSVTSGSKRLDTKAVLQEFPTGSVLKPEKNLMVYLKPESGSSYTNFTLSELNSSKTLFSVAKAESTIQIPTQYLQYDHEYTWTVLLDGKPYRGEFIVSNRDDQHAFETELSSIPHYQTLTPQAKLLLKAVKAKEWQYSYDMNAAAEQVVVMAGAKR